MKYFTLISQFDDPHPVTIDETELVKAIGGQLTGNPVVFKEASVSGSMIKNSKIIPDFDKVKSDEESYYDPYRGRVIKPEVRQAHFLAIENAGEIVKAKMENRQPQLKSPSVKINKGMTELKDL